MRITAAAPRIAPTRPAQAAPATREPAPSWLPERVEARAESWGHQGRKLGSLALVAVGASYLPVKAVELAVRVGGDAGMALLGPLAIATSLGSMGLLAYEETKLGLGQKLGQLAGTVAGAAVGAVEHAFLGAPTPKNERPPVALPFRAPTGSAPFKALIPRLLPETEKRTRGAEIGEMVGATLGTLATAYVVPRLAGDLIPGPLGLVAGSLVGSLAGMVVGGWEESTLGLGRGLGELVGRAVGPTTEAAPPSTTPETAGPGLLKRGFLQFNHLIGQPIIGFLVDFTLATNPMFAEKPYECIPFTQREAPKVDQERLIANFVKLAGLHGPSGEERLVGEELGRQLDSLGVSWERRPDGTILGTLAATPGYEDAPTVMLSAHQDTVAPTSAEAIVRGTRRIHTDGSHILGADDRAGLAEILEGLRVVTDEKLAHPEVKLVFTVDEERGLVGARRLTSDDISKRPTLGFVVDSLDVRDVHLTNDAVLLAPDSVKYNFSQEEPVVQVAMRSLANSGLEPRPIHAPILTGAGSDANTRAFNSGPIRSLAVGAGERDMHTPLEHILIEDLVVAARNVVGYLTNSCDLRVEGDRIVPR